MLHIHANQTTAVQTTGARPQAARHFQLARWALGGLLATTGGCADDPVSLGGAVAVDRSSLSTYAAVWEGYVEAHTFPSGSDRVLLVLDDNGHGSITFGEAAPRPMPTDPDDPFPDLSILEYRTLDEPYHEGLAYEISEGLVQDARLRARTLPRKVYVAAGCALQTPVEVINPGGWVASAEDWPYGCVPYRATSTRDGQCFSTLTADATIRDEIEVDCRKLAFCFSSCGCTETECVPLNPGEPIVLDGALDEAGTQLVGTLDTFTIRLTRQL